MNSMSGFTSKNVAVIIILVIFAALGGFASGVKYSETKNPLTNIVNKESNPSIASSAQSKVKSSPLFTAQNASLQATVVDLKDNNLTLKNAQGQDTFPIASSTQIFEFTSTTHNPPVLSDSKCLQNGREVSAGLTLTEKGYQITSLTCFPKVSPPPAPSKP